MSLMLYALKEMGVKFDDIVAIHTDSFILDSKKISNTW